VRSFDRKGDGSFMNQSSAFHKSVRGSLPGGALYWMARMLDGGLRPFDIARRLLALRQKTSQCRSRALQK